MKKYIKSKSKSIILIFLVILAEIFVSFFSLSKYVTSIINSDSTRAAMFIIESSSDENIIKIDCNETNTAQYVLKITNKDKDGNISEVSTKYKIILNLEEQLPDGVEISLLDKEDNIIEYSMSDNGLKYTFNDVGNFLPGIEDEQKVKINFFIKDDYIEDFKEKNISINVYSEQVN